MAAARGAAVVSGGGSGIGRAIALELARRGYPLALLGRRHAPLAETLAAAGQEEIGLAQRCDVTDAAAVARAAAEVERRWGAAEVLVPAAGVARVAPLADLPPDAFRETVETNLTGTFLLLRVFLPPMVERGRGWIFPLLSVAATRGFPGWSAYCASKWGVAGLVAALRAEVAGSGVRVVALYPGAVDTEIWQGVPGTWDRAAMVPAAEVARAVAFALDGDPKALVEEVHIGPAGGAL
ncbi:MAG TPA: SDR family oxidoreductase [Thermoanaerobaculia bacterium]|nr:SDR family oxidoreductase [Thermoanaerobaculia bacterium]